MVNKGNHPKMAHNIQVNVKYYNLPRSILSNISQIFLMQMGIYHSPGYTALWSLGRHVCTPLSHPIFDHTLNLPQSNPLSPNGKPHIYVLVEIGSHGLKHVLKSSFCMFLWNVPKPTQTFLAAGSFQALISDFGRSPGCSWMLRSLTPDKSRGWERPAGVGSVVMGMRMMIIW